MWNMGITVAAFALACGTAFIMGILAIIFLASFFAGARLQGAALHEEEIEVAVVVHVEERGAAAHDFRQEETVVVAGVVDEADARTARDLLEPRTIAGRGRRRCARARHCQHRGHPTLREREGASHRRRTVRRCAASFTAWLDGLNRLACSIAAVA